MPKLIAPTAVVRASYLDGEREVALDEGLAATFLDAAAADFDAFVARHRRTRVQWAVPVTELWYVDGEHYLGLVLIRHRLTDPLERDGGHIGYHVVPRHRRHGHATRMLAEVAGVCRGLGLESLLITCDEANLGSRRVIEHNGAVLDDVLDGQARYWLSPAAARLPQPTE